MSASSDARLTNLLGALAVGLADGIEDGAVVDSELDGRAATALVALLDFAPSGSVHRLSQVVGLTHAGAVRLVDRLVAAGYVERRPGQDARSIAVSLTPRGHRTARRIRRGRQAAVGSALAGLTERQRAELTSSCEVLIANLTRTRLARRAAGAPPAGGALCRMCDFAACGRPDGRCPVANAVAAP